MSDLDSISVVNTFLSRVERLWKLTVTVFLLTISGVLWGAKLEWTSVDHEKRLLSTEQAIGVISTNVSKIQGHLGMAAVAHPAAGHVTVKTQPEEEEP